jgi:hypothetical protein
MLSTLHLESQPSEASRRFSGTIALDWRKRSSRVNLAPSRTRRHNTLKSFLCYMWWKKHINKTLAEGYISSPWQHTSIFHIDFASWYRFINDTWHLSLPLTSLSHIQSSWCGAWEVTVWLSEWPAPCGGRAQILLFDGLAAFQDLGWALHFKI